MPRQAVNGVIQPDERRHPRMIFRQTRRLDLRFQFHGVREIAVCEQMRETINNAWRKIQRLPNLARGAAAAVTDHVRCHRRAVLSVATINFLDHRFAAVAAGEIKIDVRPAFTALVQEPFEDEMIFHRIDRSDSQAITHCTIGGAAASLDHDVVFATKIDDVPDDQEIPGEPELRDERKFFFDLTFYLRANRGVPLLRAEPDDGAQK